MSGGVFLGVFVCVLPDFSEFVVFFPQFCFSCGGFIKPVHFVLFPVFRQISFQGRFGYCGRLGVSMLPVVLYFGCRALVFM